MSNRSTRLARLQCFEPRKSTASGYLPPGARVLVPKPVRYRTRLNARPRRNRRGTRGIVESTMGHLARLSRIGVMGLEDEQLIPAHVREVRPAVVWAVADQQASVRGFRLSRDVHHGIGFDQIGCRYAARVTN